LHLIDELLARGRDVRAVVIPGDEALAHRSDVEVVLGDVRNAASLERAFGGADVVYHLAAIVSTEADPGPLLFEVNVKGARNAARAAREAGVRRFVHFASMVVFDPHPLDRVLDENRRRLNGTNHAPYTRSKVRGERAVKEEVAHGLDAVVVYPTVIVGPHEKHHDGIVRGLIGKHHAGELPATVTGGFNLVDVLDVVDGAIAAEERGRRGESYILGGCWYTVDELVRIAHAASGRRPPLMKVPHGVASAALPLVELGSRLFGLDAPYNREDLVQLRGNPFITSEKAGRELGYQPRPIHDAIRRVHAWLDGD
jgi:dihydroflavonol-4-reductase